MKARKMATKLLRGLDEDGYRDGHQKKTTSWLIHSGTNTITISTKGFWARNSEEIWMGK